MIANLMPNKTEVDFRENINFCRVVFISSWLNNPYKQLLSDGLSLHGIKVSECLSSNLFIINVLAGKPDVVHFHTLHEFIVARLPLYSWLKLFIFIFQLLVLKLLGIKIIWTVHEWKDKICNGKHDISSAKARIIGFFIHGFITHCNHTKLDIKRAFGIKNENRLFLIPHGNYVDYYINEVDTLTSRISLKLPSDALIFLIFGGIHRGKGILEAIRAFKGLDSKDTYLVIAGESGDSALKDEISKEMDGILNILFSPRRVADDEVQLYMNACDCVLVPYTVFTTSGVALLAMSFSKACIAPKAGFFLEILDSAGAILYDCKQEDGLTQAMKHAMEVKDKLQAMGQHNFRVATNWSWSYVSRETLRAYESIYKL